MTFAEALKIAMEKRKMSAAELSRKCGFAESYLSRLFAGKIKDPTWEKACILLDELNVDVDEFRKLQKYEYDYITISNNQDDESE